MEEVALLLTQTQRASEEQERAVLASWKSRRKERRTGCRQKTRAWTTSQLEALERHSCVSSWEQCAATSSSQNASAGRDTNSSRTRPRQRPRHTRPTPTSRHRSNHPHHVPSPPRPPHSPCSHRTTCPCTSLCTASPRTG